MAAKARSKNFPVFGLAEAIKRARELYDADGKAAIASDIAVQAWGYKGLNGASLRTLGAVRQFGLLDGAGAKLVRLSPTALTIILEPPGSTERAQAIVTAASAPPMFREIRDQYPDGLPSDAAIVSWLVRSHNFNEGAARDLISAYRSTVTLVEAEGAQTGGQSAPSPSAEVPLQATPIPQDFRAAGPLQERTDEALEFTWPLSGNVVATLRVSKSLDHDDIETLSAYFQIAKKALAKAAQSTVSQSLNAQA